MKVRWKEPLSKTIRTRNGSYSLPSKTIHLGIKASKIGGRNVWSKTKGKLKKLSEAIAQNNPENQAIDRVQKRIMRHAPKSIALTGRAVRGGVRVSKNVIQNKYTQRKDQSKKNQNESSNKRNQTKYNRSQEQHQHIKQKTA